MLMRRKSLSLSILTLLFFLIALFPAVGLGQDSLPEEDKTDEIEKITYSPKNVKESTGLYVFLVWIWFAIFILIYILRLKIKESDRLLEIHYFPKEKK